MRIVFASAELAPLAKVGGLGDAAAGLVRALRDADHQVTLLLPDYEGVLLEGDVVVTALDVPWWAAPASTRTGHLPGFGEVTLVDVPGIRRPHPYLQPRSSEGWPDNDARFIAFSAAVASVAASVRPDVLHLNDWHTAATLGLVDPAPPSVLTIHNLAYQGNTGVWWLARFGPRAGAYERYGDCNPLAGGIALADRVVAVSPTYAKEILDPDHGMGLSDDLAAKGGALLGIRNGIEADAWNPATDPNLKATFSAADLAGKEQCAAALREEFYLRGDGPMFGVVSRLVVQKGVDLVLDAAPYLPGVGGQLVLLGAGDPALAQWARQVANLYPEHVAVREAYDEPLAHRIIGGADALVMPSRFEPCGLNQMYAMAYGTIPVVTDVGGLHDTVVDADADRAAGTGIVCRDPNTVAVVDGLHRAVRAWQQRSRRQAIQRRGMRADWSWKEPADTYVGVYREIAGSPGGRS